MRFFFWTKYPFVQAGLGLITGSACTHAFTDLPDLLLTNVVFNKLLYFTSALALVILALLCFHYRSKQQTAIKGYFAFLLFIMLGSIRFLTYDERYNEQHLSNLTIEEATAIVGEVVDEPEIKNNKVYVVIKSEKIQLNNHWQTCCGKVKVTFQNPSACSLFFHQRLMIAGKLTKTDIPATPYEFNYAVYLACQNIHYTLYSKQSPVILPQPSRFDFSIKQYAIQVRQSLEHFLKNQLREKNTYALTTGLLIGKRSDLSYEDKQLFTNSGTIHILAVSGMHVVLIYQCIAFLALWFGIRPHNVFFNLAVLLLIWFYIFITGLQASASRAALMISIVLLGKIVQRENQTINSLFATAFLMLIYNPYYIADVGFTLSFLAVAGILISSSVSIDKGNHGIWRYLLSASLISTAAQIATFPYSIHLFHQFPVYFLLANLLVVPLSTLLLLLSILLLLIGSIPYVNAMVVFLLNTCTDFLFYFLQLVNQLPLHTITRISLSSLEMMLLYLLFIVYLLMFYQRNIRWLWVVGIYSILLSTSVNCRMVEQFHHPAIFISGTKDNRQYLFSSGHDVLLLQRPGIPHNTQATELFLTDHFARTVRTLSLRKPSFLTVQLDRKRIGICRQRPAKPLFRDDLSKKCEVMILDYTIKYSYIDPTNDSSSYKNIFHLYGKKSFYKNTSDL
ncbi:MAG: hypothetical protein JWO58_354 [Chitinophagaceae bacterium]|nr:hypothetical protein [Chitinophagaceae bacterium]